MTMTVSAAFATAVAVDQALDQPETRRLPLARYAGVELIFGRSGQRYLGVLLLLIVAVVGCGTDEDRAPATPPTVTVAHPVERQLTDEDDFNGWLQASEVVELRSRVRGHIQKIHFQDGDLVERDQLLFELDPRPFQAQVDQAKAQSNSLDSQKIAADKEVARTEALVEKNAASVQSLEKAVADAGTFDAQILAKKEEIKQYQLDLEFSRITAPIAGRISRAMLTEGNLVNAGGSDPVLTTIVALTPVYVYFSVDERTLQRYMRSQPKETPDAPVVLRQRNIPFRFGLDSDSGFPHAGTLDFADNRIDQTTGTVQVRGVVDNKQGLFVPGSRVRVRVPVSDPYSAVLVPDTAILATRTNDTCWCWTTRTWLPAVTSRPANSSTTRCA